MCVLSLTVPAKTSGKLSSTIISTKSLNLFFHAGLRLPVSLDGALRTRRQFFLSFKKRRRCVEPVVGAEIKSPGTPLPVDRANKSSG